MDERRMENEHRFRNLNPCKDIYGQIGSQVGTAAKLSLGGICLMALDGCEHVLRNRALFSLSLSLPLYTG